MDFNQYRSYLMALVYVQVDPRLHAALDPSGVVQQTLLEAHQDQAQAPGGDNSGEVKAWLSRILHNNLVDAIRYLGAAKRAWLRQQSLEDAWESSSARTEVPDPSHRSPFETAIHQEDIQEPELDASFVHDRAVRESGHDTTYRYAFTSRTCRYSLLLLERLYAVLSPHPCRTVGSDPF